MKCGINTNTAHKSNGKKIFGLNIVLILISKSFLPATSKKKNDERKMMLVGLISTISPDTKPARIRNPILLFVKKAVFFNIKRKIQNSENE